MPAETYLPCTYTCRNGSYTCDTPTHSQSTFFMRNTRFAVCVQTVDTKVSMHEGMEATHVTHPHTHSLLSSCGHAPYGMCMNSKHEVISTVTNAQGNKPKKKTHIHKLTVYFLRAKHAPRGMCASSRRGHLSFPRQVIVRSICRPRPGPVQRRYRILFRGRVVVVCVCMWWITVW